MRKFILLCLVMFISVSMFGCSERIEARYYGVAGYVELGEDMYSALSLNIPELGWIVVPDSNSIYSNIDGQISTDYIVKEGDLVEVYFSNAANVEILESFPAQFGKKPTSLTIFKTDVGLEQLEDSSWDVAFEKGEISYQSGFDISEDNIDDEILVAYELINNGVPEQVNLFNTHIKNVSPTPIADSIMLNIPNKYIQDFLKYFHEDKIVLLNEYE